MQIRLILLSILMLLSTVIGGTSIAIQPLGKIDSVIVTEIRRHLTVEFPKASITILPSADLPKEAFYEPRKRYRAEKLLDFLEGIRQGASVKIIGITGVDISTTKGDIFDWGIFGYGAIGGGPCVVSVFRLKNNVSRQKFMERVRKACVHELGHTFGLDHCPTRGCIMEDARGSVKTIDRSTGKFCITCKNFLAITGM